MTVHGDARETRSAMRSAFTLVRHDPENSAEILDALEKAMEAYVERVEQFAAVLEALLQMPDVRVEVLRRAAELMPKGDPPLRLVKDVYDGEGVA